MHQYVALWDESTIRKCRQALICTIRYRIIILKTSISLSLNCTLAGTFVTNLARLQLVQNTFTRDVCHKSHFSQIVPILSCLHSVRHRIRFKTIIFKMLQFQQPIFAYFQHPILLPLFHGIRRHDHFDLQPYQWCVTTWKHKLAKSKSFSSVASDICNKLLCHLSFLLSLLPFFFRVLTLLFPHHPVTSLRALPHLSQTSHRSESLCHLANTFQLSAYNLVIIPT